MYRLLSVFCLIVLLGVCTDAAAQDVRAYDGTVDSRDAAEEDIQEVHATDLVMQTPEARAALETFHYLKETGQLEVRQAPRPAASYEIGETRAFTVFNFRTGEREEIEFELRNIGQKTRIWRASGATIFNHEDDSANSDFVDGRIEELRRTLEEETPERSYNPLQGIIANSRELIGDPPDIDGDGVLDVLLLDIRDNFSENNPRFVAGFVDPADLSDAGNLRDIIYLDDRALRTRDGQPIRPLKTLFATAAHEYQHLIHLNYDRRELTFVNEGLSEWNEVINGFEPRPMDYLGSEQTFNVPLLRWSGRGSEEVLFDYQRAGLLTKYLSSRIGVATTGSITRDEAIGVDGYRNATSSAGYSWRELLLDFHTANTLNDTAKSPRFGYSDDRYRMVGARPSLSTSGYLARGREGRKALQPGGANYIEWRNITDFELEVQGPAALDAQLILTDTAGEHEVREVLPGGPALSVSGPLDRAMLVTSHSDPDGDPFTASYSSTWDGDAFFSADSLQYDDGIPTAFIRLAHNHGTDAEVLTRFDNPAPDRSFLGALRVPVYFLSQFSNEEAPPADTERSFELVFREVSSDGSPGEVLEVMPQTDDDPPSPVSAERLRFLELDLIDERQTMEALPESFFVGFRDVPDTQNPVVYAPSDSSGELSQNRSYLGRPGEWRRFFDLEIAPTFTISRISLPIRAAFFTPTTDPPFLRDEDLPPAIALSPNSPNPFRTETQLTYELPEDKPTRVTVYDIQGRRIATLVDQVQVAGEHTITVDGSNWASGVYIVQLVAGSRSTDRSIVLVR